MKGYDIGEKWYLTADGPIPVSVFDMIHSETEQNASIIYEGLQFKIDGSKLSVRFIASIGSLDYSFTGFDVYVIEKGAASVKNASLLESPTVYTSLIGYSGEGTVTYTPETMSGDYITALSVSQLPADKTVTLVVKPYTKSLTGTKSYGTSYAAVFNNGTLVLQYQF